MKRLLALLAPMALAGAARGSEIPSVPPFQPVGHYVSVTATTSGAIATLPTGGAQIVIYNQGDYDAVVILGTAGNPPSPSLVGDVVRAHGFLELTTGANVEAAVETAVGSSLLQMSAGVGLVAAGGATTTPNLPTLNGDGGSPAHVTNFPSSQAVTGTFWPATQPISAAALPLPTGAATAALQPALNGDGGSLAHVTNFPSSQAVTGTFWPATQPISAAALPLPTGAATAALQPALNGDGGSLAHVTNWPATPPAYSATGIYSGATIGTTDSTILAGGGAAHFLDIRNLSATATVCVNFGAAATISGAACAAGEIAIPPLWRASWNAADVIPGEAVHAIASAASTLASVGAK